MLDVVVLWQLNISLGLLRVLLSNWFQGERSTGYGVALLVTLFGSMSVNDLVRTTAPVSACDGMDTVDNKAAKKIRLN